jgi:uridine phosphorylase
MGPDNIDIVLNELDALVNIDLKKRIKKSVHTSLNIIRLGTSGAIQSDIPIDSFGLSTYGLGLDGLLNFYRIKKDILENDILNKKIESFSFNNERIINFEMETSALYGLGKLLGHNIITVCAIIANRVNEKYSKNYKKTVKKLIELLLERLT